MQVEADSQINGTFDGWRGDTLFELTNGQIWKQAHYMYRYQYAYRPRARILSNGGSYFLDVEGMNEMLEVRRLK